MWKALTADSILPYPERHRRISAGRHAAHEDTDNHLAIKLA
jgi:hypothetical protein